MLVPETVHEVSQMSFETFLLAALHGSEEHFHAFRELPRTMFLCLSYGWLGRG